MRIKELLKEKGMTAKELASIVGQTEANISRIITGAAKAPRRETLGKIADALGVTLEELMGPGAADTITCPHCHKTIYLNPAKERYEPANGDNDEER